MSAHHHAATAPTRHRSPPSVHAQQTHNAAGITAKGSFTCEARCFCPFGDTVWMGERSGVISVRCARTGNVLSTIEPISTNYMFATSMLAVSNEMWVGTTDGRLCVIDTDTHKVAAELISPEPERHGEIFNLVLEGSSIFAATANCRVAQWSVTNKLFIKSFVHTHPVRAVATTPYALYSADDSGAVYKWEIKTGERADSAHDAMHGATSLIVEETTSTLWAGRIDGTIDIYRLEPLNKIATLRDSKSRISCLLSVGGKVWGAGVDRTIYVWHAHTHALLGKSKDHTAFIFSIKKLYTMETSRIWSLSNDKSVNVYDGEGFFAPVRVDSHEAEEVNTAHSMVQNLRRENSLLEKRLAIATEKLALREQEFERTKSENQQYVLKIHALEHVVDTKEETLLLTSTKSHNMLSELELLSKRIGELTMKLNTAEQEKTVLRGDLARTEEQLSRTRANVTEKTSKVAMAETERTALSTDKARLVNVVEHKEKENLDLGFQVKALRDEVACKNLDLAKVNSELELAKGRVRDLENDKAAMDQNKKHMLEEKRRYEDTIILRENEIRELTGQLAQLANRHNASSTAMSDLEAQAMFRAAETKRLEDSYALRTHEYDLLKSEKQHLLEQLQHEKAQVHDARSTENKLRLQNDELRRQLESEKNAVKMLEDQYTIFQFVINSRGELVKAIWDLHTQLDNATKAMKAMDTAVRHIDPTKDKAVLKHEWKTSVCGKATAAVGALGTVQSKGDYIIANFLSEYEKMHLGVAASKFPPDAARPVIVGDQLLTKLRDVTLSKQFQVNKVAVAASNASAHFAASTILPPPHDATLGPQHIAPLGMTSFSRSF